ncbi:phospholipid carrier-dependent glycosyltransferase [Candidatus Woesearchaeota archaeon]|nr:phospholipid carrier-dependent glycosyltransferase [Candidatus Woesearchaeota archaeon]
MSVLKTLFKGIRHAFSAAYACCRDNRFLAALVVIFVILCSASMVQKSTTSDEINHIASGITKLRTGDFRLNREHPPLVNMISAFPLLFIHTELNLDSPHWEAADGHDFGEQYLFGVNVRKLDQILFLARLPIVILGAILVILVYKWSKELYGKRAALLAAVLCAFSPNIMAHSRLSTTDIGFSMFSFAAVFYFWRYLKQPSRKRLVIAGLMFGLMQLTKFSAVYFVFIYLLLIFAAVILESRKSGSGRLGSAMGLARKHMVGFGIILLITYAVVWAGYLFQAQGAFDREIREDALKGTAGPLGTAAYHVSRLVPIPYDYMYGLNFVVDNIGIRPAFLMGEYSSTGWWYYFPVAFLIKTPVAMLVLLLLSVFFFKELRGRDLIDELFLAVPALVFLAFFMASTINIGLRHILPIYPFIFVFVSKAANIRVRRGKVLVAVLLIWYVLASLWIWPHYLAYFNELIGGPDNGHLYLSDSNIDWGQDLKGLAKYVEEHEIQNITLSYWTRNEPPEARGFRREHMKASHDYRDLTCRTKTGWFAVSVYKLMATREDGSTCLQWLRDIEPVDKIGYSIFVYYIPPGDSNSGIADSESADTIKNMVGNAVAVV